MTPGYPNGVYLRVFVQLDRFFEALQQWCNLGKVLGHVITFSTLKPCKATWSSRLYDNTSCLARNLAYNVFVQLYCVARFKVTLGQPGDLLYHKSLWLSGPDLLKANANHRARRPWSGKRKLAPPPPKKNIQVCRTMVMMEKGVTGQCKHHHESGKYVFAEKKTRLALPPC